MQTAIGLIETKGLIGLVEATDAMAKAANVQIVKRVSIGGGLVTTVVSGDVGSVRAAVEAGASAASQTGELVSSHIIPRPAEGLTQAFLGQPRNRVNGGIRMANFRKVLRSVTEFSQIPLREKTRSSASMKILVANLGSTSFKYRLFDMTDERQLARGGVERIGSKSEAPSSRWFAEIGSRRTEGVAAVPDHAVAVTQCLEQPDGSEWRMFAK